MKRILLNVLLLIFLISCADEARKTENPEAELSFSTEDIQKSLNDCKPEKGNCTFISLTYPSAEGEDQASEKINEQVIHFLNQTLDFQEDSISKNPEALAREFIENYKETAKEFQEYEMAWEATITGRVIYESDKLISMSFSSDMFTGGAHGYRSIHYLNFKPETGERLKPGDIFTSEFTQFVEKDFREKQEIPQDANINSTGLFFENDQFHLPDNIGFTAEKVRLQYNAYEIAPYSAGDFYMDYDWTEIEEFLKLKVQDSTATSASF